MLPCVHLYMAVHFIIIFHLLCMHDSYTMHMHAIGVPEGVTLLESSQYFRRSSSKLRSRRCRPPKKESTKKFLSAPITNLPLF